MLDDYELFETIGSGPLGTVFRGHDTRLDCAVAVKVLHPGVREALSAGGDFWKHQHSLLKQSTLRRDMVRVHQVDPARGWVVSDLTPGSLAQAGPLDPVAVVSVLKQALKALDVVHERCLVLHLAVHPGNLRLDPEGFVQLSDARGFVPGKEGLALNPYLGLTNPADDGGKAARARYLAPELFDDRHGPIGPAADLYGLGMSALELLLGPRFPQLFPGLPPEPLNPDDAWSRWQRDPNRTLRPVEELLPGLPEDLIRVLDGLTAKPVSRRYGSARDVLEDLKGYKSIVSVHRRVPLPAPAPASRVEPAPTARPLPASAPARAAATTSRGPAPARRPVQVVGTRSPAGPPAREPVTVAAAARRAAGVASRHWKSSRAIQVSAAFLAVVVLALVLAPGSLGWDPATEFRLSNDHLSARVTLLRVLPDGLGNEIVVQDAVVEKLRPFRRSLPRGNYLAVVSADRHAETRVPIAVGPRRQFVFSLERKLVPVSLSGLSPRDVPVRVRLGDAECPLDELKLPVGETASLRLSASGFNTEVVKVAVPTDARDRHDDDQPIRLRRTPATTREVIVKVEPPDARIHFGGDPKTPSAPFRASIGTVHALRVIKDGYIPYEEKLTVAAGDAPLVVECRLHRPTREVRFLADASVEIRVKVDGHAGPPQRVLPGESRTFEAGSALGVQASVEGLTQGWESTRVEVQPGDGPQNVSLRPRRPERIQFSGFTHDLKIMTGGPFHTGFDRAAYLRVVRAKCLDPSGRPTAPEPEPPFERLPAEAARLVENDQQFERAHPRQGGGVVTLPTFYASEGPVTWSHWHAVMGDGDFPAPARKDPKAFLKEFGGHPATNLPLVRCQQFRARESDRLRRAGELDDAHELSLPTRAEMDYLLKGGRSDADLAGDSDPSDRAWKREESLIERTGAWLALEANSAAASGPSPTERLRPNRLGVFLGNVSSWVVDGRGGACEAVGPSYLDRPARPKLVVWSRVTPRRPDLDRPAALIRHDLTGFIPDRTRVLPGDILPGEQVGFYLVVRPRAAALPAASPSTLASTGKRP